MSYYFAIIGTQDNPLFEYEFGTAKQGGDGIARFPEQARHMNQFIVHSSLDIVEEVQWGNGQMYLKCIDRFYNNYVSCWMTGGNVKFMLLHAPAQPAASATSRASTSIAANPTSPQTEEAVKQFFTEVYENWVKTIMSPFYQVNMEVRSPVFRARVAAAGKKYLIDEKDDSELLVQAEFTNFQAKCRSNSHLSPAVRKDTFGNASLLILVQLAKAPVVCLETNAGYKDDDQRIPANITHLMKLGTKDVFKANREGFLRL